MVRYSNTTVSDLGLLPSARLVEMPNVWAVPHEVCLIFGVATILYRNSVTASGLIGSWIGLVSTGCRILRSFVLIRVCNLYSTVTHQISRHISLAAGSCGR